MRFAREKITRCNNYMDVEIFPYSDGQARAVKKLRKWKKISTPVQKNLNDRNSKKYLRELLNANFTAEDIHVSCTYSDKNKPPNLEAAERDKSNYIRRLREAMRKRGGELKYVSVTEYGDKRGRIHHHIVINGDCLTRDEVEGLWAKKKQKLGFVNADRLQPDAKGFLALANYLTKNPAGRRRWSSSTNLKRPVWLRKTDDTKYRFKDLRKLAQIIVLGNAKPYFERIYKGWELIDAEVEENAVTGGCHTYLYMRRKC